MIPAAYSHWSIVIREQQDWGFRLGITCESFWEFALLHSPALAPRYIATQD
jgi:hypothetical protein